MCTISDPLFWFLCHIWLWLLNNQSQITAEKLVVSELFFCSLQVVQKTMCTIFAQLVFHPKNRAQNRALFPKTTSPYKNSGLRAKTAPKNTNCFNKKYTFLGLTNCQLVNRFLDGTGKATPSKKTLFLQFFFYDVQKNPNFFCLLDPPPQKLFLKDAE